MFTPSARAEIDHDPRGHIAVFKSFENLIDVIWVNIWHQASVKV
jgi:hypothetical protein